MRGWRKRIFFLVFTFYLELGVVFLISFIINNFTSSWEPYYFATLIGYNFIWLNPLFIIVFIGYLISMIIPHRQNR